MSSRRALLRLEVLRQARRDVAAAELAAGERRLRQAQSQQREAELAVEATLDAALEEMLGIRDVNQLLRVGEEIAAQRTLASYAAQETTEKQAECGDLRTTLQKQERALRQTEKLLERDTADRARREQRAEQSQLDDRASRKRVGTTS